MSLYEWEIIDLDVLKYQLKKKIEHPSTCLYFKNMRGSGKFCHRGSNFYNVFFPFFSLMRGGGIQIPLLAGHQRPAREPPFKWRFAGGPMIAQH